MNRIRQHVHMLHVLSAASPQQRNAILKSATNEQIKTLCEICQNVLAGNVPKANVKRLCRYKRTIRQLADRSISLARKRKLLTTNQTRGFFTSRSSCCLELCWWSFGENNRKTNLTEWLEKWR
ncbi:uncharacterized protein TNCV_1161121 [Trichonephila clavipes]|nr:uncharacterized protein TNCV_1161121 [Trichonephila clavipes]